ncbi:MAG: hypothetical protein ACRC62_26085 [Microcoleus sp.]
MRVTISKAQHRSLIQSVCNQLGSEKPIDALEHILNCWLVGNVPPSVGQAIAHSTESEPQDEMEGLVEF